MDSFVRYMPLSPQKDESLDSLMSSYDDFRLDDGQEDKPELYEHIGAPIPLPKEKLGYNSDVRTAYRLNFSKLPDEMYNAPSSYEEVIHEKKTLSRQIANTNKTRMEESEEDSDTPQTLFELYPKEDERLVYWKYPNQGDWEMKTKIYASYLIHVEKLLKNKDVRVQYKRENNSPDEPVIQRTTDSLHFDSLFESGNLFAAYKISDSEYDLILQNDINTRGHTQWFFFSVSNTKRNQTIKFNLVNLLKTDSLFNFGMKPVVFSTVDNETRGDGWKRTAFDISYYKNNIIREGGIAKSYYTLTFTHTFKHDEDTVYFAHCYPYTYSDLKGYLTKLCEDERRKMYVVRRTLCYTLAQNECEYLSITAPSHLDNITQRHGIVLTSRQHPGETLSSYIMEGVINFLTSEEPEAQYLRRHCVFKIVPMLNPDGVIHGNYRTSLCGKDLNRVWNRPNPRLHPTIYQTQELIRRLQKNRKLEFYCDLHGHSRKKNAFFYGNAAPNNIYKPRIFPMILSNMSKYVTFKDSQFVIQKSKENTARIALWKEFAIDTIFTLEASFYGFENQDKVVQFTKEDYRNLGHDLCKAIFVYVKQMLQQDNSVQLNHQVSEKNSTKQSLKENTVNSDIRKRSVSVAANNLKKENVQNNKMESPDLKPSNELYASIDCKDLIKQLKQNKELIAMGNKGDDSGSDTGLSEDDLPARELRKVLPMSSRKKKKKLKELSKKKSINSIPVKKEEKSPVPEKLTRAQSTASMIPVRQFQSQSPSEKINLEPSRYRGYQKTFGKKERAPSEEDELTINQLIQTDKNLSGLMNEIDIASQQIYKPTNNGPLGKCFTSQKMVPKPGLTQAKLLENGKLFVIGAKAGIESYSTVDLNSKFGRNQISRSILAKIKSKFIGKEEQFKHLEKRLTPELYKKPFEPNQIQEREIEFLNSPSIINDSNNYLKSKQYSSSTSPGKKNSGSKISAYFQEKFTLEESEQKYESVKLNLFFGENKLNLNDGLKSLEKHQVSSLKSLGGNREELLNSYQNGSIIMKQPKRLAFKEKDTPSTTTLPQILAMNSGRVDLKEATASLINDSSLNNLNSFKVPESEELQKIAFFKLKPPRANHRSTLPESGLPSERDLQDKEKLNKRRERISMDPIKYESKTNQSLKQFQSILSKDPSLSPQKHRLIKLEKNIMADLDKKGNESDLANLKKLRKSQSSFIRKIQI